MFQNSKAFDTRNELSEFEIATVGGGFFERQDELKFGNEFLFTFGGIVVLVDLKVVDKCKESLHDEMRFLVLDSVKCHMLAGLENVLAVMVEDAFKMLQAHWRDGAEGLAQ